VARGPGAGRIILSREEWRHYSTPSLPAALLFLSIPKMMIKTFHIK